MAAAQRLCVDWHRYHARRPAGHVRGALSPGPARDPGQPPAGRPVPAGGLHLGFIGRILLKHFRDVRGDALFGKRTFLVRHGRRWTCGFSACCWFAGTCVILVTVRQPTLALLVAEAGCNAAALGLIWALSRGPRRDEQLISAIVIVGRAMLPDHAAWAQLGDRDVRAADLTCR